MTTKMYTGWHISVCCEAPVSGKTVAVVRGKEYKRNECDACMRPCRTKPEMKPATGAYIAPFSKVNKEK